MSQYNRGLKVVIIGDSGVGKTSIRGQYISGRFTNAYKATIGTDFISKTLPHYNKPGESVTLQIWDTAGQERFSSLAVAFFRGADAVIMVYDVNKPETLQGLRRWWNEFKDRAPVMDEEAEDYCCVVVGNKIDLSTSVGDEPSSSEALPVSRSEAEFFLRELIPVTSAHDSEHADGVSEIYSTLEVNGGPVDALDVPENASEFPLAAPIPQSPRTQSILINRTSSSSSSQSRPNTQFHEPEPSSIDKSQHFGTMTSTRSRATIYHTPSSSFHDEFMSAPTTPAPSSFNGSEPPTSPPHETSSYRQPRRMTSASSSSSAPTITPSLFQRTRAPSSSAITPPTPELPPGSQDSGMFSRTSGLPSKPERGPKLFLTSARTGEGVAPVFEYIAKRVTMRNDYLSAVEDRTFHIREGTATTIRLAPSQSSSVFSKWNSKASCCGS
ncbi:ras-domain-containing protein [Schizopora paradoxa]|uniref:Ras-domain-containing protein n=1 Tax=Schizopora paradoxa TaxID=27342 RepID=A0A0H2S1U8_9AGAM|nr:ras-domain-containing protein [Schizopora paradoxa]